MFTIVVVLDYEFVHLSVLILTSALTKHVDNLHLNVCGPFTSNKFQSRCKFQQELHWASISDACKYLFEMQISWKAIRLSSGHHKRLGGLTSLKAMSTKPIIHGTTKFLKLRDLRQNDKKKKKLTPKFHYLKKQRSQKTTRQDNIFALTAMLKFRSIKISLRHMYTSAKQQAM